jgi:hypothetical protein
MFDRVMIFGLLASVAMLLFVLELVRRRKLKEEYSLLWLATGLALMAVSLSRNLLDTWASIVGVITYPPSALFLLAMIFFLFIMLHFSTVLTRLTQENKESAQQIALLRYQLEETQKALATRQPTADEHQHD